MLQNLFDHLQRVLEKDERCVSSFCNLTCRPAGRQESEMQPAGLPGGEVLRNRVVELARKNDGA